MSAIKQFIKNFLNCISLADLFAAQHGYYGHGYWTTGQTSYDHEVFGAFFAVEDSEYSYRDVTLDRTHTITALAGDWVVGRMDTLDVTSGNIRGYYAIPLR